MAHLRPRVTYKSIDPARLPDEFTEGAALLMELSAGGVIAKLGEKLHIRRQGGYCGLDVWVLLLLFFAAGATCGVKSFWKRVRPYHRQLAALAYREKLPATASLSRALCEVEVELVRPVESLLLIDASGIETVLHSPSMRTVDAKGEAWHVFDLDPTVTTLRHRALPDDEEMPVPRRRSEHTGAPGYSGRKRGDVQFRRVTVQHAGSSAYIHAHLSLGNGEGVEDFERALDAVVLSCERLSHPLSQTLVRMDGEAGSVPYFTACRVRGVPFITRLNRPKLYEEPAILERLRSAVWHYVPDSLSGPRRSACDLGELTIEPGERTKRPDGSAYEPVRVRVVASRYPVTPGANRGVALDGWQVELFAVDVPADAFPAPEAVASYFGRTGQENRFAQEDRELGLDRIVSYHLPGQELAMLVGLSLWNMRVAKGFSEEEVGLAERVVELRQAQVDQRAEALWPRDPVIAAKLSELPWKELLANHPGWRFDEARGELRCEEQRPLVLTTVRPTAYKAVHTGIILCRPSGGCKACSSRDGCLKSSRENASKHLELAVPTPVAEKLRERLLLLRGKGAEGCRLRPVRPDPGERAVMDSMFLPARARELYRNALEGASIRVEVALPAPAPAALRLVARDVAERQHRRKTWAERLAYNALPEGACVEIEIEGSSALRARLGEWDAPEAAIGRTG